MSIEALLFWRSPDSTERINKMFVNITPKGVYWGGTVTPNPAADLTVTLAQFVCKSYDGMTVRELTATHDITFATDGEYYVGLLARYVAYASPVLELMYYPVSTFSTWPEKDYFIKFARVLIPPGHTGPLSSAMIFQDDADDRDFPLPDWGSRIRVVAAYTDLPTTGVEGDTIFVIEMQTFYIYYSSAWHRDSAVISGTGTFSDGGTTVTHNLGHTNYDVSITPNADPLGYLGEVYITKSTNWFVVTRSGSANTTFDWLLNIRG